MMLTRHFKVTLQQDAVFTESAASAGPRMPLTHVPGGILLGVAARSYDKAGKMAWDLFHSGRVRFGNAYPILEGAPSLPVPLTWREGKGKDEKAIRSKRLDPSKLSTTQGKRLGTPYFTATGVCDEPDLRRRQRTAIDRKRGGQSRRAALFEDVAVTAGTEFWFSVTFEEQDALNDRMDFVSSALCGDCVLGANRTAEYGRAEIRPLEQDFAPPTHSAEEQGVFHLYCLSDVLFEGALNDLFEGWGVAPDLDRSTLRRRPAFAPFNGHRGVFSQERGGLAKGSVLVFDSAPEDWEALCAQGLGTDRAAGFGAVIGNPWFLPVPSFKAAEEPTTVEATEPVDALFDWAVALRDTLAFDRDLDRWVEASLDRLAPLYKAAISEARATGQTLGDIAPTRSQWGSLRSAANELGSKKALETIRDKTRRKQWSGETGRGFAFADELDALMAEPAIKADRSRALATLCEAVPRRFVKELSR